MKFGTMLFYEGLSEPDFLLQVGQTVEDLGFDSVWLADHVVVPDVYDSVYPYNGEGKVPTVPFPEPLVSLGFLAAATKRIELGTAVVVLPQRNPVLLAKQAATLDRLSGGRLRLGVGVGWLREEFAALGEEFAERGARTDDYIDAMRALWTNPAPRFKGRFAALDGTFGLRPEPAQAGGVPIVIGGHTPASARRAAIRGDGYFPYTTDEATLTNLFSTLIREAAAAGRPSEAVELIAPTTAAPDWIPKLADLGVGHAVMPGVNVTTDLESLKSKLGRFSDRVIAKAR